MRKKLDRTLGLFSAIAISIGTMIGSAIFVLAGTSFDIAGPSASLAVFLAGLAAFPTAFCFAELVTIIPRAGGGYAYAREATDNNIIAFITGWGFWLAYAMSCGLFAIGFGHFLHYLIPVIPDMIGAYGLIIYIMFTNIKGTGSAGSLQNMITSGLLLLLLAYIVSGFFSMDVNLQQPFFPKGTNGTFTAMGLLYITYIGYGLVTTASEEIINPAKTIPKAILFSLTLVIIIKTSVFFLGSSLVRWEHLIPSATFTPMTDTAVKMAGALGGKLFALAGIFATVSSINTALMAASRTSFAMSRDGHLPAVFKNINTKTQTPIFSVLTAAAIAMISTGLNNLEYISAVTSLFALTGYSFVNVALMIFRKKMPDAKRAFKVPLYPFMPIAGIAVNIFLVIRLLISDLIALSIAFGIILLGIIYYYALLPKLRNASKLFSTESVPTFQTAKEEIKSSYKVLIPIASPTTAEVLIDLGLKIVSKEGGVVQPVHVVEVPKIIPMDSGHDEFLSKSKKHGAALSIANTISQNHVQVLDPLVLLSRHTFPALKQTVVETAPDMVIIGWHPSNFVYQMLSGFVGRAMEEFPANIGILKKGKSQSITKILYPYGGGFHSQASAQIIRRIALSTGATVTFFHVVEEGTPDEEITKINETMRKGIWDLNVKGDTKILHSDSVTSSVIKESEHYDLLVIGAGHSWGTGHHVAGVRTDAIMTKIKCGGLVIRQYTPFLKTRVIRKILNSFKEMLLD